MAPGRCPTSVEVRMRVCLLIALLLLTRCNQKQQQSKTTTPIKNNIPNQNTGKPQPPFELVSPALPTLARLIYSTDEEVLTDACWAVCECCLLFVVCFKFLLFLAVVVLV
jgi:hypothetical protein